MGTSSHEIRTETGILRDDMQTVWIQFVGEVPAKPVEQLREGDVTVWNGGVEHEIAGVEASPSGRTFRIRYADGSLDPRRMRAGRLVAVAQ